MQPVIGVAEQVGQIGQRRDAPVMRGARAIAGMRRRGREGARRQGRIMRRVRLIGFEQALPHLGRERLGKQREREHRIGLFRHAPAIDGKRVEVQQQRIFVGRGRLERPGFEREIGIVLGIDLARFVERQEHHVRRAQHPVGLRRGEQPERDALARGESQVPRRHQIGVEVVVDDRGIFVGSGHAVEDERAALGRIMEADRQPDPRGLDQHCAAARLEDRSVAGRREIGLERVGDIGVDVILRRAGGEIGRAFVPADRPPRIERARGLSHRARIVTRGVEPRDAPDEHCPRDLGMGVGEDRQHVEIGIPEDVALIALAGLPLGTDRGRAVATDRHRQFGERIADREFGLGLARNGDRAGRPEVGEPGGLLGQERVVSAARRIVEHRQQRLEHGGGAIRVIARDEIDLDPAIARAPADFLHRARDDEAALVEAVGPRGAPGVH